MEENKISNPNNLKIDELIQTLNDLHTNHNYQEFQHTLYNIKQMMDLMPYNEFKYLTKNLIPFLIKVFEILMNIESDNIIFAIKMLCLEVFNKMIWYSDLIEVYQAVLNFIPKILQNENEELGIRALKIFLEYYKNMKKELGWSPVEKFMDFTINVLKNFELIVSENYSIICRENPYNSSTSQDKDKDKIILKANKSFKVINELPIIIMLCYNIFQEQMVKSLQENINVLTSLFKVLRPNPFKNNESDPIRRPQIGLYEDYLYSIIKIEYLTAFLLKIGENLFEIPLKKFSEDIVKAVIFVLENLPRDNIIYRKEVLSITKNLIKPFASTFFAYKDFFRNEENLLGKSTINHDYVSYEANKIIFTLIDNIHILMNFEEKGNLVEELVMKINNFSIGYESKLFIFYYISQILDIMLKSNTDAQMKLRLVNINNIILRELSFFFDILARILTKLTDYYVYNRISGENNKYNKYEYLDQNLFDNDELNLDNNENKPDINKIQKTNFHKIYELIINNEYEKFVNPDETKSIIDVLKHSNALLKVCVSIIQMEHSNQLLKDSQSLPNFIQPNISNNANVFNIATAKKSYFLKKLFKSYIKICEKVFKNHTHGQGDEGSGKLWEIHLITIYLSLPSIICTTIFSKMQEFIFKSILNNSKICPMKNCLLSIIIDTIFDTSSITSSQEPFATNVRKELFDIFLDYYMNKIQYIGNNLPSYNSNFEHQQVSMSVLINIFKCLFKYLNLVMEDRTKQKITNFLVSCLILTKKSKFFGNYLYVIRCLFKNLLNLPSQSNNPAQFEFYKETVHLVYGIMKFMIKIKEEFPFLKEMLTEIIMIFPIKFKYMIDYAKIVFPSLLDALNMNQEIVPVGLQYLEQWLNALFHKPENVKPFLQNNINVLTTLLTSHLYKNYSISLNSLKLLSKFGGRSRNYLEDKQINPKTSPTNILVLDLLDLESNKEIEFPIDNIVDLCIKIVTNYKRHSEKNWLLQIKTSFKTLKNCFLTFIGESFNENNLDNLIRDISESYNLRENKPVIDKTQLEKEQIKINIIYRKAEHFLVEKLLRGLFLCCTIPEIEEDIKEFVKFICEYFTLIMISKNKSNRQIDIFEIDPTIILDIIGEFLFSNNPTVFKNNNQTCISIAIKLINYIIDFIENLFDKNNEIIKNLEIIDIIFMKLLNACYNNEWSKKGGGVVTLLILVKRFSKEIIFKYLEQILRTVFHVTSNYSSTVKIKYEGECEQIINELIKIFIADKDKPQDINMMYKALRYFQVEIFNNLHQVSEYSRKTANMAYEGIIENSKIHNFSTMFLVIDQISFEEFIYYYSLVPSEFPNFIKLDGQVKSQIDPNLLNLSNQAVNNDNNFINKQITELIENLSFKIELDSSNFTPILSKIWGLFIIMKKNKEYFFDYIMKDFKKFILMIKNLIDILVTDMFLYLEITKKIHEIQFNSKFKYFFIEKFYSTKQLHLNLSIKVNEKTIEFENTIPDEYMNDVVNYLFTPTHNHIFEQYMQTNNNYTSTDPYICEIFPILSNKIKMMRYFIKFLRILMSNKKLIGKLKEKLQINQSPEVEEFFDLRNKCTNLIFRFIIYREEKSLLKISKKYIRKMLKCESTTKNLLPEDDLRKCIKPVLEQVAVSKTISYKLAESLAILLKLLSLNFNETLGKKLMESINQHISNPELQDNTFVHCVISLFAHLKPAQVEFPALFEILFKQEREFIYKNRPNSFYTSKFKLKIIKLLSNFPDHIISYFCRSNLHDIGTFDFYKKLLREESAYNIRDVFAKYLTGYRIPHILSAEPKDYAKNLPFMRIFKILVKVAPVVLNLKEDLHKQLNDFLEEKSLKIFTKQENNDTDVILDDFLKCIVRINFFYFKAFNKNSEFILNNILYRTKTRHTRIKEKIKFFAIHDMYCNLPIDRIRRIFQVFTSKLPILLSYKIVGNSIKYLILPMLVHYIQTKSYDEYIEKYFARNLIETSISMDKRLIDDSTTLELFKLYILFLTYFMNPNKKTQSLSKDEINNITLSIWTFLGSKYTNSSHALSLYSGLGLSLVTYVLNKQGDKILNSFSQIFFRQIQYDHLNIMNLSLDILVPFCMSKPEECNVVLKTMQNFLKDRAINFSGFFHIFTIILRYPNLFIMNKVLISNIIVQFIIKSSSQYMSASPSQKKVVVQLLGLIIYWFKNDIRAEGEGVTAQIDKIKDNTLTLLLKYFRMIISPGSNVDPEIFEIAKRYLLYIRESIKMNDFNIKKFLSTENEQFSHQKMILHFYMYSLKIAICYCNKESILKSIDYFFAILKNLNRDPSLNIKPTADAILILKSIINYNIFDQINENRHIIVSDEIRHNADIIVIRNVKEFLEHHQNIFNKKKGKLPSEIEFDNIYQKDINNPQVLKEILASIKCRVHNYNNDKLLELFPHFDYRNFTIFHYYINELNTKSETIEHIIKLNDNLSKLYFENWYVYTVIIIQAMKEDEATFKKAVLDNPECDYFSSASNFFANLKPVEVFDKIKKEKGIKISTIEKKVTGIELLLESIFIGFYNAFNNANIIKLYKYKIQRALLYLIEILVNTSIQNIIEYLITLNLQCLQFLPEEKNRFILSILKLHDGSNKKIPASLVSIFLDYLEKYNHTFEKDVKDILKILLSNSKYQEYQIRQRTFKVFEKFNGLSLISKLKWIFQIEMKNPDIDNNSWLAYSVDFLLHHFQNKRKITRKLYCSKLKKFALSSSDDMIVDDINKNKKVTTLTTYFSQINSLKTKSLLVPIRDIVLGEIAISQKMWFSIFPQVWRILDKNEQETFSIILNDFLIYLTNLSLSTQSKGPLIVKAILESVANCSPLIKLNPEVIFILAKHYNSWNSVSFYLEKMISANIEKERSFISLNKIYDILKEDEHCIGLKRFISFSSQNQLTKIGLSHLQCSNYYKAEEVFVDAFKVYKRMLETDNCNLEEVDYFPNKIDFSIWESGLIESYRKTNKWDNILQISEESNNLELKIEAMWHCGKWNEIEQLQMSKNHYLAKINQIYMMMNQSVSNNSRVDLTYQQKCMECIKTIFQDFLTYPANFERLNYNYFLIFQMIVEAWESTNTLKEIERNILERRHADFRENLIMWRDRIPHVCEGFHSLKSVLEPRNFLFDILRDMTKTSSLNPQNVLNYPNVSDHIWNHVIFLKFARKLKLYDVFVDYLEKFNKDIVGNETSYPIEIYLKNMEHFKIFRGNEQLSHFTAQNYSKGYELVDEILNSLVTTQHLKGSSIESEVTASYFSTKGYFAFKLDKIAEAHECFQEAVSLNGTDYHIWKDWALMSDYVLQNTQENPKITKIWLENTLINYFTMIIFKLDKSKYIIPRVFRLINQFPQFELNVFDKQLDNIPTWVWLFWIPQLLELLTTSSTEYLTNFSFKLLDKIAKKYPQNIYYPLLCHRDQENVHIIILRETVAQVDSTNKRIPKIDLIINELNLKMQRSILENILSHMNSHLDLSTCKSRDEGIIKIKDFIQILDSMLVQLNNDNEIQVLKEDLEKLIKQKSTSLFDMYNKIKNWRYYLHSKITTESNFKDLNYIIMNKLYNTNFDKIEIPGLIANKFIEPNSESRVFISRFESEYSFKFLNFSQKKLLIRGSNEKLYNFSIIKESTCNNSDSKMLQLQSLLNAIFASNKDTYKSNVKFNLPVKYQISPNLKLVQEETSQYYMNEIFEFCTQKVGYDPEIAYEIYQNENKNNQTTNFMDAKLLTTTYEKMCSIFPVYSMKSFIHKFIINSDENFIFRKQFATSYAINNFLSYMFKNTQNLNLNKISFNKETGSVCFHDIGNHNSNEEGSELLRLTKNINYFLSPACLYGIVPGVIQSAANAIYEKQIYLSNIFYTVFYSSDEENNLIENNQILNDIFRINNKTQNGTDIDQDPMKNIIDLINNSVSDEQLAKMPLSWNPWF